jgi:hypothetical protein
MTQKPRQPEDASEVETAAIAFERELRHYEALARAACRDPLDSRKNIERAAGATRDAAAFQERTVVPLQELAAAMSRARERFETASQALGARAQEIQARMADLSALFARFETIQVRASEINARVVQVSTSGRPAGAIGVQTLAHELDDIAGQMDALVEETRQIATEAHHAQLSDLGRDAEALRQQVLSARQKLMRARTSISPLS